MKQDGRKVVKCMVCRKEFASREAAEHEHNQWEILIPEELPFYQSEEEREMADKQAEAKAQKKVRSQETSKRVKKISHRWKRAEDWWRKILEPDGWKVEGHMKRGVSCSDFHNEVFSLDITTTSKPLKFIFDEIVDSIAVQRLSQSVMRM